jgi:dTDP-4-amino-4,6-dideoxygalactose transaminase
VYNQARIEAADRYDKLLDSSNQVVTPHRVLWSNHIFHQYTLKLVDVNRQELIHKLLEKKIPAMVYYPIPLHRQKAFEGFKKDSLVKDFPNTDLLCSSVVSLPMHTELNEELQEYIVTNLLSLI